MKPGAIITVIPLAEGEKDQRIREADGYRLKRINEAEGDAARFSALLAEYIKAPEVTRRRINVFWPGHCRTRLGGNQLESVVAVRGR
jgi:hypothetical protein